MMETLGSIDGAHGWLRNSSSRAMRPSRNMAAAWPDRDDGLPWGAQCRLAHRRWRNHSYRVRYYEPAGTDATLYEPKPDFRFRNDMAHPVLINAYASGSTAIFEFWGTRMAASPIPSGPRIFNIVQPPPMKLIETTDLPPGQKKCTESAHAGAMADPTVTYPNGEVKSEVFRSHYRPWQAVCPGGKAAGSPEVPPRPFRRPDPDPARAGVLLTRSETPVAWPPASLQIGNRRPAERGEIDLVQAITKKAVPIAPTFRSARSTPGVVEVPARLAALAQVSQSARPSDRRRIRRYRGLGARALRKEQGRQHSWPISANATRSPGAARAFDDECHPCGWRHRPDA